MIGVTGSPGVGKSTLVDALITQMRKANLKVGVLAVDPSSPFTGGAILGDRIRMTEHANDEGVFIRSMATHGATGGMARAALDAVDVLDVAGFRTIIVETVGVGQDEVEVARASDTTVVVSAPGLGDEIQAIKAGVLEIADIHVVSKCDRDDANRTLTDLKQMLTLGTVTGAKTGAKTGWAIPVVGVSAFTGLGLDELLAKLAAHKAVLAKSDLGRERRREIAAFRLTKIAETLLLERFAAGARVHAPALARVLAERGIDPYAAAQSLIEHTL